MEICEWRFWDEDEKDGVGMEMKIWRRKMEMEKMMLMG